MSKPTINKNRNRAETADLAVQVTSRVSKKMLRSAGVARMYGRGRHDGISYSLEAIAAIALIACSSVDAQATSGGFYSGPVGGTDFHSALIGAPGSVTLTTFVSPQWGNIITGPNWKAAQDAQSSHFEVQSLGMSLSYVYPFTWRGGHFESIIQSQYFFMKLRKDSNRWANSGFNDPYVDVLAYSFHAGNAGVRVGENERKKHLPFGLQVRPAFSVVLPVGRYNFREPLNEGHNAWIFVPNVSLTYTMRPMFGWGDATEISTRIYYAMSLRDPKLDYRSGDIFVDDFAFSQRLKGFQIGIGGTVANQVADDIQHGQHVSNGGHRLFDFLIGPVAQYNIPKWHSSVGIKYYHDVTSRNRVEHDFVLVRASFSL